MKLKANNNLTVAQLLINQQNPSCCATIVHCSYYAVFQYMKYMLANTRNSPISYAQQEKGSNNRSSHEYILQEIKNKISNNRRRRDFDQEFRALKRSRRNADYKTQIISTNDSLDCKQKADSLIAKLKQNFGDI